MRRGVYKEDVALQPRPAREFASKLFVPFKHAKNVGENVVKKIKKVVDNEKWLWYSNLAVAREQNIDN